MLNISQNTNVIHSLAAAGICINKWIEAVI